MIINTNLHTGGGEEKKVIFPIIEHMCKHLKNVLVAKNYGSGVDDFLIMPYAVFSDEKENSEFAKPSHKIQRTKDYYGDKGWIKTIVFALPFNPDLVSKADCEEFRILLCNTVLERLEDPQMKILKTFNYEIFKKDVANEIIFYRDNIKFK